MQRQIEFTVRGSNSLVGNFTNGDRARLPAALAAHLVDEAKCARYVDAVVASTDAPKPATKHRKGKG